jgi:hypothetical protein
MQIATIGIDIGKVLSTLWVLMRVVRSFVDDGARATS